MHGEIAVFRVAADRRLSPRERERRAYHVTLDVFRTCPNHPHGALGVVKLRWFSDQEVHADSCFGISRHELLSNGTVVQTSRHVNDTASHNEPAVQ